MKKLLLVINEDRFFLSHRTRVAENAKKNGWDVTLVTKDTGKRDVIEKMGFRFLELPVNPTGMNPREEMKTLKFLYKLYKENPDAVIHQVGLKNMLWGGLASRLTKTKGVVYAVSGLGTLFGESKRGLVSRTICRFLKFAMNKNKVTVIFQNHDDEDLFIKYKLVKKQKIVFIKGSGVDLDEYGFTPAPDNSVIKIIFTARMLREKGVIDLVEAAEILRPEYEGRITFLLCGGLSANPSALKKEEIEALADGKYIQWLGHCNNVADLLKESDIMCFPSYYREGVPRSLIEASSIGRPIVTTDSVGCRDTVVDGVNGFIVPKHSPEKIAEALKKLIDDKTLRERMGKESRKIAEKDYDVNRVADIHLKIYECLDSTKKF
jgi:glycosyltransferase involved in cell wall biosynthesis